jgi:hypothetical protein
LATCFGPATVTNGALPAHSSYSSPLEQLARAGVR